MFNRGSEWHKWDLHLHSPKTWLNNKYLLMSDEDFIERVIEADLKAVGLTNYFRFAPGEIDGHNSLKDKLKQKGITVFPNLEFRLSYVNKQDDLCDYHLIFHNNLNSDKINTFLSNLTVKIDGQEKKASELTDTECRSTKLYVDFDTLQLTLNDPTLNIRDKIISGFLSRGHGESRSASVAKDICSKSEFVIHASASQNNIHKDYEYWTQNTSKPIRPIYQGSDAHQASDIGKKFTWIKAQPTFDGLLQTLNNPVERISFNQNKPTDIKSNSSIIDKLTYSENKEILFNNDLNSIIGIRGSGKSMLLKALAIKINPTDYEGKVGNAKFTHDQKFIEKNIKNATVEWSDGAKNDGDESNPKKIFFLPQGYLSNLAYDESNNMKERDTFIINLLRKNETFRNAESQVHSFISENSQKIEKMIHSVFSDTNAIKQLEEDNSTIGSRELIEKEIKDLSSKIKLLSKQSKISEDENTQYQNAIRDIEELTKNLKIIKQDVSIVDQLTQNTEFIQISDYTFSSLSDAVRGKLEKEIRDLSAGNIRSLFRKESELLNKKIKKSEENLLAKQTTINNLKGKFEGQLELKQLTEKRLSLEKNKKILTENLDKITHHKTMKDQHIKTMRKLYFQYRDHQSRIFETVQFDTFEFLKINITVCRDKTLFSNFIERYINRNTQQYAAEATRSFLIDEPHELTSDNLTSIIEDIIDDKIVFKKGIDDRRKVLRDLLDNPYKIDFLNSIQLNNSSTTFRDMTGGQKAVAMLELIFKFDTNNYPILIDQPEDDLDTRGIATTIVDFIKKQKELRQIFIVSHNGSLVVCADSEEIIVANNGSEGFTYKSGAIEDETIRNEIIGTLEGGETALKLRMSKLMIKPELQ